MDKFFGKETKRKWDPYLIGVRKTTLLKNSPILWDQIVLTEKTYEDLVFQSPFTVTKNRKANVLSITTMMTVRCLWSMSRGLDEDLESDWPLLRLAECLEFHYSILLILHAPTKTCFKRPIVLQLINRTLCIENWLPGLLLLFLR